MDKIKQAKAQMLIDHPFQFSLEHMREQVWRDRARTHHALMNCWGIPEVPRVLCKKCKRDYTSNPLRGVERCVCELHDG